MAVPAHQLTFLRIEAPLADEELSVSGNINAREVYLKLKVATDQYTRELFIEKGRTNEFLKKAFGTPSFYTGDPLQASYDSIRYSFVQNLGYIPTDERIVRLLQVGQSIRTSNDPKAAFFSKISEDLRSKNRSAYKVLTIRQELAGCMTALSKREDGQVEVDKFFRTTMGAMWLRSERMEFAKGKLSDEQLLARAILLGLSYPLVEDVLDQPKRFSEGLRSELNEAVYKFLRDGSFPALPADAPEWLKEAVPHVESLFDLADLKNDPEARTVLLALHIAQDEDLQLSRQKDVPLKDLVSAIGLKAAFSRIAAGAIMGVPFCEEETDSLIRQGIINQLFDDIADLKIDQEQGTPTLFTRLNSGEYLEKNPFDILFKALSMDFSTESGEAKIRLRLGRLSYLLNTDTYTNGTDFSIERMLFGAEPDTQESFLTMSRDAHANQGKQNDIEKEMLSKVRERVAEVQQQQKELYAIKKSLGLTLQDASVRVNEEIEDALATEPSDSPYNLKSSINDALSLKGGNFRSLLGLLVSHGFKPDLPVEDLAPLFSAMELLQTASLIIDDLPQHDDALLRRGKPALHISHGEAAAQLTAVSLVSKGMAELSKLYKSFPPESVNKVSEHVSENILKISQGQLQDIALREIVLSGAEVEPKNLFKVHLGKTGLGIQVAMTSTAILMMGPQEGWTETQRQSYKAIENLGKVMGILYQVKDDLSDLESSQRGPKDKLSDLNSLSGATLFSRDKLAEYVFTLERSALALVDRCHFQGSASAHFNTIIEHLVLK